MLKLLAAGLIASAAIVGTAGIAAADPVTITFRFNDTEQEVRGAIDEFQKQNPDIKVELQRIGWKDARNQFLREAAVGQGPDVAHVAQVWVTEMGDAGATLALDDFLQKDPPPNGFADFAAQDLAHGKDGKIYGLPWTTDTWAMVYRTDLLKEAGIDSLPTTWEDMRKDSEAVYKKTGKAGFGFPAGSSASGAMWFLANFYWWSEGKALIVQKQDGSYTLGLEPADVVAAMNYYKQYMDGGDNPQSNLAASDAHDPAIMQALVSGNQAMGAMPPNTYKEILKAYADANPGKEPPFASGPFPHQPDTNARHQRQHQASGRGVEVRQVHGLAGRLCEFLPHPVPGAELAVEADRLRRSAEGLRRAVPLRPHLGRLCQRAGSDRHAVECHAARLRQGLVGTGLDGGCCQGAAGRNRQADAVRSVET